MSPKQMFFLLLVSYCCRQSFALTPLQRFDVLRTEVVVGRNHHHCAEKRHTGYDTQPGVQRFIRYAAGLENTISLSTKTSSSRVTNLRHYFLPLLRLLDLISTSQRL
ncbi:unnamed protein product [Calicophoron daubneyi]|uniref:Secreted protein n=1 Tax=Calicophoron daubneyi TaxID=300641 RepID=A0AAV2TCT7_CALDB